MRRIDPAAMLSACILLVASATSAVQFARIPVPHDAQGHPVGIEQAKFHGPDLLVLLDSAGDVHETRDTGRTWKTVPVPVGKQIDFFGEMLETSDDSQQYRDGRWTPKQTPMQGISCGSSWTSSGGYAGCVEEATGDVVFQRSMDTLLTWSPWFQVPAAKLAEFDLDRIDELGADAGGRIWWQLKNTSTLRGTADGKTWIDVPAPQLDELHPKFAVDDTMFIRGTNAQGIRLGLVTTDLGRHWDSIPVSQAGGALRLRYAPGKWLATSRDAATGRERIYIGSSVRGPWEPLPDSTNSITLSRHHDLLIATPGTLAWVVAGASGIFPSVPLRQRRAFLRVDDLGWNVVWPAGATEGAWRLNDAHGRVLSSGHLSRGQKELTLPRQPLAGWLVLPDAEAPLAVPGVGAR